MRLAITRANGIRVGMGMGVGVLNALGAPIPALTPSQIASMVIAAANQYGVPPQMALAIASHESGFNPNATNLNKNGTTDWGVMQLNDTTVQTLGVSDPLDPQQNIDAGVGLLAKYLQQYGGNEDLALQAYASGPGTVASGAAPNAVASQFINYVQNYTPSADITSALDTATAPDTNMPTDMLDASTSDNTNTLVAIGATALLGLLFLLRR